MVGTALRLQMPDQSRYLFSQDPDGKYRNTAYPSLRGTVLTRLGNGTAELRWKDGMIYAFNAAGWLVEQRDRYNNSIQIIRDASNRITEVRYDAIGRLTSISDSVGGNITWTYDTVSSGHHPRVQETTTPGTVTVEYDEIGRRLKHLIRQACLLA